MTEVDGDLEVRHVALRSPLVDCSGHPPGCDDIGYLRYRLIDGPVDAADADAICVIQPGAWGGAYSLDRLARNTLRAAAANGCTLEWWSLARRAVGAWDRSGIDAAEAAADPTIAFDYYYRGAEIAGRRFAGFQHDRNLPFLAEFGLARAVADEHEVLTRELPGAEIRRTKVLLGGHSLGGLITGCFVAWDFEEGPGHDHCAGLVAIDTLVTVDPVRLSERPRLGRIGPVAGRLHKRSVQLVRRGVLPRTFTRTAIMSPETMGILALAALGARHQPGEVADVFRHLPTTRRWNRVLAFYLGRSWAQVLTGRPNVRDLRMTNEAALGLLMGGRYAPIDPFNVSFGELDGPTGDKTFPFPRWVQRLPGIGPAASGWINIGGRGPTDPEHLYRWRHEVATETKETARPIVDLQDYARMLVGGPLGYLEGYFPMRTEYDIALAVAGARDGELAAIRHEVTARAKPTLHVFADAASLVPVMLRLLRLLPTDATLCPGYLHIDMASAAIREDGAPEPVSTAIADFALRLIGSRAPNERVAG